MTVELAVSRHGVFDRSDELAEAGHEQVVFCRDDATGLRAIISIHDTTLGPALGGTRFHPYRSEDEALTDGLRLAQGMTFKAAAAGMALGGGKAVIIGDPAELKSPDLLRAYGRFIERLGGLYVTAADVGTTSADLDVIGETTRHVVGRGEHTGGSGDSGLSTATGVFHAMRAAARHVWGVDGLRGRTVGVEGAGKVGSHLVRLLVEEGARVAVADPCDTAVERLRVAHGADVRRLASVVNAAVDVYAPCALGATLTPATVAGLRARLVCGAANNQLATSDVDDLLTERGITWVPDYVANAGGLIQVGGELWHRTPEEVADQVRRVGDTAEQIVVGAAAEGTSTGAAADRLVRARLAEARRQDGRP
ncbi:Glu/Leu/Phe/Val family dehydrogenase [Nocardioides daeguensis]|uniref:Glu/Leu/Phe/Val dehydrogenase dimerization domain-containing protein n=1 Tax=Nocardioides daeguensis TaxID=908359 RepID=A0ABP6V361_9ACTN|nr:Glu/Leu/Phe/Val dehydrogenase dimerization domain-containing protein [Nocardioides daeguensis]MBV6727207.1 valine dehydrogenase [Nocardioides daeguensis]MCR1771221.1 valine dehydrogenase [Nocardioides daeguensis]